MFSHSACCPRLALCLRPPVSFVLIHRDFVAIFSTVLSRLFVLPPISPVSLTLWVFCRSSLYHVSVHLPFLLCLYYLTNFLQRFTLIRKNFHFILWSFAAPLIYGLAPTVTPPLKATLSRCLYPPTNLFHHDLPPLNSAIVYGLKTATPIFHSSSNRLSLVL